MIKIYKKFKPLELNGFWFVVVDGPSEIVIAKIPTHLRHPKAVAEALSSALTNSKFVLTDLV